MAGSDRRRTNRRVVYETLRRRVLTLELPPGSALSENELAAALGVSRTPVRESLILLAEEGLVQVFPQVGSFVSRVDPARVADAQFLREAVELAALDDLPADPDPELVAELRENIARQQRPGIDVEEFFGLDEEFHRGLLRLSSHGSAWSTVVSAKGHLDRARRLGLYEVGSPRFFADQHEEILRAVLDHDIERARRTMRGHLRAVFEDIEQLRSRSPELFASNSDAVPVRRNVVVWE
ncbi:GntR family transcriptional regulator [Streptomyces sp. NBC_00670]|jgi:DNA-binding GntR family transcriptional regulator|uniref:GntR family transcriptional regulator n=1 Tax=Streptomyces sp. NBC_00670 TaxID=2975804 RepID=UPI002E33AEA6|nr:GntR family transcriptional regulator [Streptomyces sp. NBC_00670]